MADRPIIVSIEESQDHDDVVVSITLDWRDERFVGAAHGDQTENRARLAGEATLRAVEMLSRGELALELLAMATTDLGAAHIALAQVRLGGDEILIGNALQSETDPGLAAARAVMSAVNRRLGLALDA